MSCEYKDLKDFLLGTFSREYIFNFGSYLYEMAEKFIKDCDLVDKVFINKDIFFCCFIDILVDIARLRDFHDITNISKIKYRSYCASWWIRRKPIRYKENFEREDIWINERFALSIMLQALDKNLYQSRSYNSQKTENVAKMFFYHLKYRNINPQGLELFLVGLDAVN